MNQKDYSKQYLKDQLFSGEDLSGSDFSESELVRVNFTGANLANANFSRSKIFGCDFESSNLTDSKFNDTYIGADRKRFWLILVLSIMMVFSNIITSSSSVDLSEIAPSKWIKIYKHISIYTASSLMLLLVFLPATYWFVLNFQNFFFLSIKDFAFFLVLILYFGCCVLLVYSIFQAVSLAYKVSKTSFLGADLTGAIFKDSLIRDVDFSDATLTDIL